MAWLEKLHHPEHSIKTFLKWGLLGLLMGGLGGLIGAGFHHALHFVTHLRGEHTWLTFLLPLGGLLTVGLYKLLKLHNNKGTNEIIDAALHGHPVPLAVFPGIFLATVITHLFGGSAGREGAALQLGGSTASCLAKVFRLDQQERKVMVMSGMTARSCSRSVSAPPSAACWEAFWALTQAYAARWDSSVCSAALPIHPSHPLC